MPKGYVGNTPFKVNIGADRVKAVYKGSELIYQSQTDTETLSVSTGSAESTWVYSSTVTVPKGYTKFVVETASASGGNFGTNYARLVVNGASYQQQNGNPGVNVSSWVTTYNVAVGNAIQLIGRSERDHNRDDRQDALIITITYHFE